LLLSDALEVKDHSSPNSILHQRKFFSKDHYILQQRPFLTKYYSSPNTILHQRFFRKTILLDFWNHVVRSGTTQSYLKDAAAI